jgi:hypothetical protein
VIGIAWTDRFGPGQVIGVRPLAAGARRQLRNAAAAPLVLLQVTLRAAAAPPHVPSKLRPRGTAEAGRP